LEHVERKDFIHGLAYLADIFTHINEINLSIQGPEDTIMDATENLQAFMAKLSIWKKRVEADIVANFQMLEEVPYQDGVEIQNSLSVSLKREICEHLETLRNSFRSYFYLDGIRVEPWIRSHFLSDINCIENVDLAKDGHNDFPTLVTIKTKSRNRLDVQHDLRVALSKTTPQFNVLIHTKQQQPTQ
jgi:hypothetical protein